ncbi:MAG: hypothetical protein WAV07_08550 [Candidatus Contendobacter sp.]
MGNRVGYGAKLDTLALVRCLRSQAAAVKTGDLAHVEAMLMNQATALQSLFARLVERGMSTDTPRGCHILSPPTGPLTTT